MIFEGESMQIVLLSGGSGQRLWPLSNDVRSKQFLKIFKEKDDKIYKYLKIKRFFHLVRFN